MMAMNQAVSERGDVEALLPWHAAGTLSRRDAERVEATLAADPAMARSFEIVREELAETIHLNETLGAPSARAMERLFAAIDADGAPARRTAPSFDLLARVKDMLSGLAPRTLAWSAAAAALAIVVQAGIIANVYLGPRTYEVAGVQQAAPVAPHADALIRFVPQATAAEVTKFLDTHHASIVEGPMSGDLYRIRIAVPGQNRQDVDRVIEGMRAEQAIVGFVGSAE
jgi:hypothetical protein